MAKTEAARPATRSTAPSPTDLHAGRPARRALVIILLAIAATVPVLLHPWLCDDIFITFRYVQQARAGHGLVYNPGERVEGYTHFLWTIVLWALATAGLDLESLGRWLPLPFYAGSVVVLGLTSSRLFGNRLRRTWGVPAAALLWAVHREAQAFASGGLETAAYTFFLVLGFYFVAARRRSAAGSPLGLDRDLGLGIVAYSIAALLRPEGLVHVLAAVAFVTLRARGAAAGIRALACAAALVLPLFVWRTAYYHDLVPNSFHAKSAGHAYWSQGLAYVGVYYRYYAVLIVALPGALLLFGRERHAASRDALLLAAAHAIVIFFMTAYVGGDFMFARFLLPATPFLCLLCEQAVLALPAGAPAAAAILAAGVIAGGLWRERTLGFNASVHGIADERSQYSQDLLETRRRQSESLARCFASTRATFLIQGSQASYAYLARMPVAIEAYGLTDRTIARLPLSKRGRPGHERRPPLEYLLRRHANFLIHLPGAGPQRDFARIRFGDLQGEIIAYDRALLDQARACSDVEFTDFPAYFDAWLQRAPSLEPARLRQDAGAFRLYYFDHNPDAQRAASLEALLAPQPETTGR